MTADIISADSIAICCYLVSSDATHCYLQLSALICWYLPLSPWIYHNVWNRPSSVDICCHLLLSICHLLIYALICCYLLVSVAICLSAVICCYLLLSAAKCCYLLSSAASCCRLLLSAAICCYLLHLQPSAAICYLCSPLQHAAGSK